MDTNQGECTPDYQSLDIHDLIAVANQGIPEAQRACGIRLFNAENATRDYQQGLNYLEQAAAQGDGEALNRLGVIFHNGIPAAGISTNYDKAISYYERAMCANITMAYANCGLIYLNSNEHRNVPKAIELFEVAAERGNTSAQRHLGRIYDGSVSSKDFTNYLKAKYWYEKAIESGSDGISANNLAILYENGAGGLQDPDREMQLYKIAAEQNVVNAQSSLGLIYRDRYKDYVHSAYWLAKAANRGDMGAANALSVLFIDEKLGIPNTELALYYCALAQRGGVDIASKNLQVLRTKLSQRIGVQNATKAELSARDKFAELETTFKKIDLPLSYFERLVEFRASTERIQSNPIVQTAVEQALQAAQITPPQLSQKESRICCPICKSTQISAKTKGFGLGKAVAGTILAGSVGLLGGFIGSRKNKLVCMNCGHEWSPGSIIAESMRSRETDKN